MQYMRNGIFYFIRVFICWEQKLTKNIWANRTMLWGLWFVSFSELKINKTQAARQENIFFCDFWDLIFICLWDAEAYLKDDPNISNATRMANLLSCKGQKDGRTQVWEFCSMEKKTRNQWRGAMLIPLVRRCLTTTNGHVKTLLVKDEPDINDKDVCIQYELCPWTTKPFWSYG